MVTVIDVLELSKRVLANNQRYAGGNDPTIYKLIPIYFSSLKIRKFNSVDIVLQNDPNITSTLNIQFIDDCLRMYITFKSKNICPNLKYKASLYYFNWNSKLTFLESINLENIHNDSIFHFSRPIQWFIKDNKNCFRNNLFNDHWFLYCQITRENKVIVPKMIIKNPKSEMIENFSIFYKNDLFSDVKIICDNKEFLAHKLILVARSSVFKAMLKHKMKEIEESEITISDIEPEILEHLLRFIYTDTIKNLEQGQAEKLLAAANTYALENLKLICMKEISKSVKDIEKAIEVLSIAENFNVIGFKEIALDFIKNTCYVTRVTSL